MSSLDSTTPVVKTSGVRFRPLNIKRFVLCRGPLIIAIGTILLVVLAPQLLNKVNPTYRAEVQLMLTPLKQPTLQGRERDVIPGDLRDYMRTLTSRITSYNVLRESAETIPQDQWPEFMKEGQSLTRNIYRLMSRIHAREIPGTYLFQVSLEAAAPGGLAPILNAVTQAFLEQLALEQEKRYSRQLTYLREERQRILTELESQRKQLTGLADKAGQRAFLHKSYEVHLSKVQLLQRLFLEQESDRITSQAALDKVLMENERLLQQSLTPYAEKRVADNFGINRMEQWTYESLQELRASIDGLSPTNPDRQYVEQRMEAMEKYLVNYRQNVYSNTLSTLKAERALNLNSEKIRKQSAVLAANDAVKTLADQKAEAEADASRISGIIFTAQQLIYNMEQLQSRLAALDSRLDDNQIQAKAPLPVHVDREATSPHSPVKTNRKKLFLIALFLAFASVGGCCFLFDLLDNRIHNITDVERLLLGGAPEPLPVLEKKDASVDFIVIEQPDQLLSKQYRKLAVRLLPIQHAEDKAAILCVTAAEPQAGVSSVCANLGASFGLHGERVLVVDLNANRPSPLWHAASPRRPGASNDLLSRARTHPTTNLQVISSEALRKASRTQILSLLATARDQYDRIVVDLAPVLDDDLSQWALRQADAALVVARDGISLYDHLWRVKAQITLLNVPAMTIILNGAGAQPGSALFALLQGTLTWTSKIHHRVQDPVLRLWRRRRQS